MASTTPPSEPSERGGSGVRGMRLPTCHKVREPCGACRPLRPALRRRCISFHDSQQPCCVGEGYDAKRAMCNPRVRCATPDHAHKSPITRAWAEPTRAWRDDHAAVLLGVCTCQHHVQRLLGVARAGRVQWSHLRMRACVGSLEGACVRTCLPSALAFPLS